MEFNKKKYKYLIGEFTGCINDTGCQDMDIIPSLWVKYDSIIKTCIVPYPAPPYTDSTLKFLNSMIKNKFPPLESWPKWPIVLKGGAGKFIFQIYI